MRGSYCNLPHTVESVFIIIISFLPGQQLKLAVAFM